MEVEGSRLRCLLLFSSEAPKAGGECLSDPEVHYGPGQK